MGNFFPVDGFEVWPDPIVDSVTALATSTLLAPASDKRIELVLTNYGVDTVWVNIGAAAEVGKGLSIPPAGGVLNIAIENDTHGWRLKDVYGIVGTTPSAVSTFEQRTP
jgi:hypothetical protein